MVRRGRQAVSAAAAVLTEAGIVADRRRRTRSRPGLVVFADGRTKRDQSWIRTRRSSGCQQLVEVEVGVRPGPLGSAMLISTDDFDPAARFFSKPPTNMARAVESTISVARPLGHQIARPY